MRVTGVDVSLTATGIAWATAGEHPRTTTVRSDADDGTMAGRSRRLRRIVTELWPYVQGVDLVVIEQPPYGMTGAKVHDRSGLWWMLVGRLTAAGTPVVEVTPTTLKVYALGKAGKGSDKDAVLAAVVRRYLDVEVRNNNEADALVLACMGLRALGQPYDPNLPQTHTRAMAAPAWPNR